MRQGVLFAAIIDGSVIEEFINELFIEFEVTATVSMPSSCLQPLIGTDLFLLVLELRNTTNSTTTNIPITRMIIPNSICVRNPRSAVEFVLVGKMVVVISPDMNGEMEISVSIDVERLGLIEEVEGSGGK